VIAGIINFLVLVFLFRKLLGDKIVQEVEKRRTMLEKLKKADDEYKKMIEFARKESDLILEKAEKTKKDMIHEAHLVAEEEKSRIIKEAHHKADLIVNEAKQDTDKLERELKESRVASVKETSKKVVKRLLKHDKVLEDEYFGVLVEDLKD
jgi:ATP synthase subunit b